MEDLFCSSLCDAHDFSLVEVIIFNCFELLFTLSCQRLNPVERTRLSCFLLNSVKRKQQIPELLVSLVLLFGLECLKEFHTMFGHTTTTEPELTMLAEMELRGGIRSVSFLSGVRASKRDGRDRSQELAFSFQELFGGHELERRLKFQGRREARESC
jgi:hypothetical protein